MPSVPSVPIAARCIKPYGIRLSLNVLEPKSRNEFKDYIKKLDHNDYTDLRILSPMQTQSHSPTRPIASRIVRPRFASRVSLALMVVCAITVVVGCTRDRYRFRADKGSYKILHEKADATPWALPGVYSIDADPRSRLFDPTDPNDPMLPPTGPQLYSYEIPTLSRPAQREPIVEELPSLRSDSPAAPAEPEPLDSESNEVPTPLPEPNLTPPPGPPTSAPTSAQVQPVSATLPIRADDAPLLDPDPDATADPAPPSFEETSEDLTIQPIPEEYWDALPRSCLSRMLEFESARVEYRRTYGTDPPEELRDPAKKLTFENIVELGFLNSRSYQTDKEALYRVALQLTLQRYDYMTKFTPFGNGSAVDFDHTRTNNVTVNQLSIPSTLQADRMVALGGTMITQFANDVVLRFDGSGVILRNVNSSFVFDFLQSIYQRDILLEPLIQSERNVVYAARRFTRSRRETYVDFVNSYYGLLSRYRAIELDAQNYFALARQLEEEFAVVDSGYSGPGTLSRIQIDQIEQNMLRGRRGLIRSCNGPAGIDRGLDELNVTLGLPTETPININLAELEQLTIRDDTEVRGEQIRRTESRLAAQLAAEQPDREEIVSASIVLTEFLIEWLELRAKLGDAVPAPDDLRLLRARLRIDEAYEALDRVQQQLTEMINAMPPTAPINIFRGTMNVVNARVELVARKLQFAELQPDADPQRLRVLEVFRQTSSVAASIQASISQALLGEGAQDLRALQTQAENTLQDLQGIETDSREMVGFPPRRAAPATEIATIVTLARNLAENTNRLVAELDGLPAIDISVDDAMITGLVQRLELMNERGLLADDWRSIKLTADELKSRLNFNLRQTLATSNSKVGGIRSSLDTTRTELGMSLDLPLNRRQQRNDFRSALIDYQQGRRNLMALEDGIKLDVRQDLRSLELNRVQYGIDIISAALASERVYSTKLELSLGLAQVTARDFLEALATYRQNLSEVANDRFNYIQQRAKLTLDLELLLLDENGLWPELNNSDYQPQLNPIYPFNAGPTYGELPLHTVWPSKKIKRQLLAPPPGYAPGEIIRTDEPEELPAPAGDPSLAPPNATPVPLPPPPATAKPQPAAATELSP